MPDFNTMARSMSPALAAMGFFPQKNPADAAMPYLNNIQHDTASYYDPYINAGRHSLGVVEGQYDNLIGNNYQPLQNQYTQMAADPNAALKKISEGYTASPGYNWQVKQATNAANNAAAAGGMLGSPAEQQALAETVTGLANKDYYNYLSQALGLQRQGMEGMQNFYNQGLHGRENLNQLGFQASDDLATKIAQALMSQSELAYAGQANKNESEGGGFGALAGLASAFL